MKSAIVAALACALAASCDRKGPPAVGEYEAQRDGGQTLDIAGVRIETAADLPERTATETFVVNGDNNVVVQLRGWPIVLRNGQLEVAGRSFGAVPQGSVVRIGKDGVRVGDELRGPLP